MDTKLKKWKSVVSLLVFFLGISLLLAGLVEINKVRRHYEYGSDRWKDLRHSDFQETDDFSSYLTGCLESFLSMASGGLVSWNRIGNWSGNSYNDFYYGYDNMFDYDYNYDYSYSYDNNIVSDWEDQEAQSDAWQAKLNAKQAELDTKQAQLDSMEREMDTKQAELDNKQAELDAGDAELNGKQAELNGKQAELNGKRAEMSAIVAEMNNIKAELNSLEAERNAEKAQEWKNGRTDAQINKEYADKLHGYIKDDKNMLYRITAKGKELYTNAEDLKLDGAAGPLPEGYNFLLYFDGAKVKIMKDGKEVDVYGDGLYSEDCRWYVPGYVNFKADKNFQDVTITIAVAKDLKPYYRTGYRNGSYENVTSGLYFLKKNLEEYRVVLRTGLALLAAGIILLIGSLFLRKWKREGDRLLASKTGKIWFEGKLLVAAIPLVLVTLPWITRIISYMRSEVYYYEMGYESDMGNSFFGYYGGVPQIIGLALCFLIIYLFINDMLKNKKVWRNGICYKIFQSINHMEIKLPAAQRMLHRGIWLIGGTVLFGVIIIVSLLYVINERDYYQIMVLLAAIGLALMVLIQVMYLKKTKETAQDMDILAGRITQIHNGDYESTRVTPNDEGLAKAAAELEDIRRGMEKAIDETVKSERMKVELVTNVSHDIKTPLTSIISYVEFLKQEEDLPEHVKDYIRILDEKSKRLHNMVQDVFAVSKAASGQLPVKLEVIDFGKLLNQTIADMEEEIQRSSIMIKADIPEQPVMITADGQRLYRVFQNLIQNALKYSLEGSRVYLTLTADAASATASVKNISRQEIKGSVDFTERFSRGDESRSDGGSGLGLSIARSFTEACGGNFHLETNADLFVVTVTFDVEKTQ